MAKRYAPGRSLGAYEVIKLLHTGGMAAVYSARRATDGHAVALKIPHPALSPELDAYARLRLLREGEIAARVGHPFGVRVFGVETDGATSFLVMELLTGSDLAEHLAASGPLGVSDAVAIIQGTIQALAATHVRGIIHMDIKPANIMLARDWPAGTWCGCSILASREVFDDPTEAAGIPGHVFGTLRYMSPEGLRRSGKVDPRGDQFSVGLVLYECLTGTLPFGDLPAEALLAAIMRGVYTSARVLRPEVPVELDAVICRVLRPSPEERYPIIEAMERDLAEDPGPLQRVVRRGAR